MSTYLNAELFLAIGQTVDLATSNQNDWNDLSEALIENDVDYAWTEWTVSSIRYCYAMNFSQPDFPAYPATEVPKYFRLTLRLDAVDSSLGPIDSIYVQMGPNGTRREFATVRQDQGTVTRTFTGYLNEWGITQQEANDIMDGTASVNFYALSDDPDSLLRVMWGKLEALVQEPQTEILAPPSVL